MVYGFLDIAATPAVKDAQAANGSLNYWEGFRGDRAFDRFTEAEAGFIARRDSFYMATVSETGWPYMQHRGGPAGFLRVLDERTLGFADYRGNRQYVSLGNVAGDDRASLFLMDYPNRSRLKIFAHVEVRDVAGALELADAIAVPGYEAKIERAMLFHLETFDWNCPQHITPRFTETEIAAALVPLHERVSALESENAELRARLAGSGST